MAASRARIVLAVLIVAILAALTALAAPDHPPPTPDPVHKGQDRADVLLYEGEVAAVRAGGDYYRVAADAQRSGGYPVRPMFTMRLPTLVVSLAAIPAWAAPLLLWALCIGVTAAWFVRLRGFFSPTPPIIVGLLLLISGMLAFYDTDLVYFHEIWSGLLIALALAVWRPGRWMEAVGITLVAMLIRETSALFAAIMCIAAFTEGRRREALAWVGTAAILAVAVAFHAQAWARVVQPNDPVTGGWLGLLGFGFFVKTMTQVTALAVLPLWLGAPLVVLAIFGWSALRDPLSWRVVAMFAAYGVLVSVFCRIDTYYWVMLVAPLLLVGLAFAVDGGRDLVTAAIDRRRITVTRITP
jgi:hypothetical protein